MRIHVPLFLLFAASFWLDSCTSSSSNHPEKSQKTPKPTGTSIDGKYLVDNVFFPQDTLVLHKMQASDSTTREKLLVELKNDSIYLSNHNFGGWYGKWFCPFHAGKMRFEKDHLYIHADVSQMYKSPECSDKKVRHKIDYRMLSRSDSTLTFLKMLDTTNCPFKRSRKHMIIRSRGRRDFQETIRSDIQLR